MCSFDLLHAHHRFQEHTCLRRFQYQLVTGGRCAVVLRAVFPCCACCGDLGPYVACMNQSRGWFVNAPAAV